MERRDIAFTDYYTEVIDVMSRRGGLLLASRGADGRDNAMAIGWGAIGSVWSMPVWIVLVRPSRYTWQCIEHGGCFTVNVPAPDMAKAVSFCGTHSGRDGDKLVLAGLKTEPARRVAAPVIAGCPIVYECEVVHRNDVVPEALTPELLAGPYARGDYHRVYSGKIVAARAVENAAALLG